MNKTLRWILGLLTSIIAFSAILGGIALLLGLENFPIEWLEDSPFNSYTIPALILIIIVGGSSLLATFALIIKHKYTAYAAMIAGFVMMGQITGEIMILKQQTTVPHWIEYFYFGLGLIVFVLALFLRKRKKLTQKYPVEPESS